MQGGAGRTPEAIVVGGGFAGLSAATLLAERGVRVLLLEARPYLGGRARSWVDPQTGSTVDNGQHLFLGCYRDTLRFLDRLGSADRLNLQPRLSVPFVEPGGAVSVFALPPLPVFSWSLLTGLMRFPGLAFRERLGLLRVAREVHRRSRRASPAAADELDDLSVSSWLRALGQSARAEERLWHPLATAALNEDPGRASAALFLPVLRELLLSRDVAHRVDLPLVRQRDHRSAPGRAHRRAVAVDLQPPRLHRRGWSGLRSHAGAERRARLRRSVARESRPPGAGRSAPVLSGVAQGDAPSLADHQGEARVDRAHRGLAGPATHLADAP